ncbi:alpha/beta hydrolase [Arthrobacter sp. Leaf141]|uniref:alpha/beta hydrolase n=1 Tax=Arthrobacter sp. Leaf141 TaxID=1736273 RepID=UPI0006F7D12B|nr:alpha/beta hydrolase [Arthrobacter sp. Leaf141]KQR00443.1 alpha/beta hydrolase [Arthrobacter sp. Leaf141]
MRWYKKDNSAPGSAVIFLHGGGMIAGSVEIYDPFVRQHVQWSGVPMLSVDYTLAPGTGDEAPAYEALAAIQWVLDHAATLQIDPERVAIMGDSAGGGIAAATAILARDRGINIAQQILVFPMLDDRTLEMDPQVARFATWTHEDNYTGWRALLGDRLGSPHVSAYFAPSRLEDFAGLAPAYIEVGTLDLFRDECISYAQRLLRAGVQTELHVHPGAPHGYDSLALGSSFAARWKADRVRVIRNL